MRQSFRHCMSDPLSQSISEIAVLITYLMLDGRRSSKRRRLLFYIKNFILKCKMQMASESLEVRMTTGCRSSAAAAAAEAATEEAARNSNAYDTTLPPPHKTKATKIWSYFTASLSGLFLCLSLRRGLFSLLSRSSPETTASPPPSEFISEGTIIGRRNRRLRHRNFPSNSFT